MAKIIRKIQATLQAVFGVHKRRYAVLECNDDMVTAARAMHADAFLKAGFISSDDVDDSGSMKAHVDKYHDIAEYFIAEDVKTGEPKATCRLLSSDDISHLQAVANTIFSDTEKKFLESIEPTAIVELSGLAKKKGESQLAVLALFRAMLMYSRSNGIHYWIMVVNEGYYGYLSKTFPDFIYEFGKPSRYMNTRVISCVVSIDKIYDYMPPFYRFNKMFKFLLNSHIYLR